MSKIIKPKLNPNGSQVIDYAKKGDWYFIYGYNFGEWSSANPSMDKVPIYYAEEWRPKKNEAYYYFHLQTEKPLSTIMYNDDVDTHNLKFGNYYQTLKEAENPENILKVLDNMKKYYQDKPQEAKND